MTNIKLCKVRKSERYKIYFNNRNYNYENRKKSKIKYFLRKGGKFISMKTKDPIQILHLEHL